MRTRSRPALQDKTPGNTPQSHRSNASRTKEAFPSSSRKPLGALVLASEPSADENGTPVAAPPSPKPVHVRRLPQPPPEPVEETGSEMSAPPTPTPARIRRPTGRFSNTFRHSSAMPSDAARHSSILSSSMLPVLPAPEPLAYGASSDSSAAPSPSPTKSVRWPTSARHSVISPTFRPYIEDAPSPLPTKTLKLPSSSRPSGGTAPPPPPSIFEHHTPPFVPPTPKPKHVKTLLRPANEDEGILASPTPIKTGLGPLPAQSTPLPFRGRRRPRLPLHKMPARTQMQQESTIAGSSKGKQRARQESLPPSSPPPFSPSGSYDPGAQPFAVREDLMAELEDDEPLEPEDKENMSGGGAASASIPLKKERSKSSEDDPFGFFAAERNLKVIRKDKAPAVRRAPLGTLAVTRRTLSLTPVLSLPAQLPTPGGSDADVQDENVIENRFGDIDSPGLHRYSSRPPDPLPSDPAAPPPFFDDGSDVVSYADPEEDDKENAAPADPASQQPRLPSEVDVGTPRVDPPRTPHKSRSARQRSPLASPHFECDSSEVGEGTPSRSLGLAELRDITSSVPARGRLQTLPRRDKDEEDEEAEEAPGSVAAREEEPEIRRPPQTRKRQRGEAEDDLAVATQNLVKLLPKRPPKRAKLASDDEESDDSEPLAKRGQGRGRGRGKGPGRGRARAGRGRGRAKMHNEDVQEDESGSESDVEDKDARTEGKKPVRAASARGRGTSRGRGRGRGRGRAVAASTSSRPASTSTSTRVARSRSQKPASKQDKGKKRARDEEEEVDIDEDEERSRSRQARIEYFRKLDEEYSLEKEDVYVI